MSNERIVFDLTKQIVTLPDGRTSRFSAKGSSYYWHRLSNMEILSAICATEEIAPNSQSETSWWKISSENIAHDKDDDYTGDFGTLTLLKLSEDPYKEGMRKRVYIPDSDDTEWVFHDVAKHDNFGEYDYSLESSALFASAELLDETEASDAEEDVHRWYRTDSYVLRFRTFPDGKWEMLAKAPVEKRRPSVGDVLDFG
jgi:hypothetical protein